MQKFSDLLPSLGEPASDESADGENLQSESEPNSEPLPEGGRTLEDAGELAPETSRYVIQVLRGGVRVEDLETEVCPHSSYLVGKHSRSRGIIPEIDLRGEFGPTGDASLCSREQARILWVGRHLLVTSLGANPMAWRRIPSADSNPFERHAWEPGDILDVPGGLVLKLVECSI